MCSCVVGDILTKGAKQDSTPRSCYNLCNLLICSNMTDISDVFRTINPMMQEVDVRNLWGFQLRFFLSRWMTRCLLDFFFIHLNTKFVHQNSISSNNQPSNSETNTRTNLKDVKESLLSLHTQHEQKKRQLENLLGTIDKMLTRKPRSQEPDFHTSVVSLQTYFLSTLECMHLQSYEARCPKTCRLFLQSRAAAGRIY